MVTAQSQSIPSSDPAPSPWTAIDWSPYVRDATIDGRRLRYLDYGDGSGNPPLVLIHGLGGCWQWWLRVLPALGRRHRVIAVDLPGFGDSDVLPPPSEMSNHAQAMAALLDQLSVRDATVAGHSMGGLVTLALAQTRPDLVGRVVLVNAGGVPMSEARLSNVIRFIRLSHRFLGNDAVRRALTLRPRARAVLSKAATGHADAIDGRLGAELIPRMAAPGFVEAVIAAGRAVRDTNPEAVRQPVLLLWGDADPIVPIHTARTMAARLAHPTLVAVHGSGHTPFIDAPDRFLGALEPFIDIRPRTTPETTP